MSIRHTGRPAEAGIEPSVGGVGDSLDSAPRETATGLFKAGVIRRRGPWRPLGAVGFAALERAGGFGTRRRLEPIGNMPPAGAEERHHARPEEPAPAA